MAESWMLPVAARIQLRKIKSTLNFEPKPQRAPLVILSNSGKVFVKVARGEIDRSRGKGKRREGMATKGKEEEPALGVPYGYAYGREAPPPPQLQPQVYYVGQNPYQAGAIPPNAVYGDPKGIPLQQTMYRDTPAPFQCVYCGSSGLTTVRSKPSLAAAVGCMMPFMLGVCFLCPSMDCLWHKYHYCPSCQQKVADFEKSDPCLVMDPPNWQEPSFAVPA